MKRKKPSNYTDEQWEKFISYHDKFIKVLKDEDEAKINLILDDHPDNIVPEDEHNEERRVIQWKDCPLNMTASYYANNKVFDEEMPVYEPEKIKELLDAQS